MYSSSPIITHQEITSKSGMVVAQHRYAAQIGVEVLQRGGNAVDAAVAAAFASGVLLPIWNGVGGGGVMNVHLDGESSGELGGTVDFGMQAPRLAHSDMYELEDQLDVQSPSARFSWPKVKNNANTEGYTSIAIPGTVAGLSVALEKWGTIDLDQAVAPAVKLAREGFSLSRTVALSMAEKYALLSRFPVTRKIYLNNGSPLSAGAHFVQKEHAETLERLGQLGASDMYGGETSARIAEDVEKNGGYLRLSDFEQYKPIITEKFFPGNYRGLNVSEVGGPCAGPTVVEILHILEAFDLTSMGHGTPDFFHTMIEAIKLAAVDRFTFMGDPSINGFPIASLGNREYGRSRASQIDIAVASEFSPGDPWTFAGIEKPCEFPAQAGLAPDSGTTSLATADKQGNMVALTQTNLAFSGVVNPGVGVMMNDAMGWSNPMAGTVNSIAPFARALNNMTPTILHDDGRALMAIGGSGGRKIWPAVVQVIVNRVDFGMSLQEALEQPRVHVESDGPIIDPRDGKELMVELASRGHHCSFPPSEYVLWPFSEPNGITFNGGLLTSGLTPQTKPAHAAGY